jgi:hypothetical protein
MGSQGEAQERLFYSFRLEDHVPKEHLLRATHAWPSLCQKAEPAGVNRAGNRRQGDEHPRDPE